MRYVKLKQAQAQTGIVLPLALVMLVMITLIAVVAIRGVTTEERIAANLRAASVAFEQAEIALRYCEAMAWNNVPSLPALVFDSSLTTGQAWQTSSNWTDPRVQSPPATQYQLALPVAAPRCMIERVLLQPPVGGALSYMPGTEPRAYVVTARGFGDNGPSPAFRATVQSQLRPR